MIDISKMKALAMKVGGVEWYEAGDSVSLPDGDTIACCQSSIGHMPEPIHYDDMVEYLVSVSPAKILSLLSELEAREADRRDAERYRIIRDTLSKAVGGGVAVNDERLYYQESAPGEEVRIFWYPDTPIGFYEVHGADLDSAADALALAQRQEGEDDERA
ncbi:hypothetical protein [Burkholderia vietnamiensis]|uniref:hypothetical protein n=1 Tax=Burkholderia vietnamiensis TaxID=60552 RepID=UPI001FC98CE5|nr:hypothetical protein [Burkholderia vietnamiensis]